MVNNDNHLTFDSFTFSTENLVISRSKNRFVSSDKNMSFCCLFFYENMYIPFILKIKMNIYAYINLLCLI